MTRGHIHSQKYFFFTLYTFSLLYFIIQFTYIWLESKSLWFENLFVENEILFFFCEIHKIKLRKNPWPFSARTNGCYFEVLAHYYLFCTQDKSFQMCLRFQSLTIICIYLCIYIYYYWSTHSIIIHGILSLYNYTFYFVLFFAFTKKE